MKTSTVLVAMKQVSDSSHTVAPNSTIQSIDLAKSKTALPLFCDDIEHPSSRNKIIMDSFNGVSKTTIGRGKEDKLAGQILTFNIKDGEKIPEKIDEGRLFLQVYQKRLSTLNVDDAYDEKTAFTLAMAEPGVPRDFLARLGCCFVQKPGRKSEFQKCHKKALLHLVQVKPNYDNRKLECYALPLAMFFLIKSKVDEEEDETVTRLFVESFKDTETVIENLVSEMDKVDSMLESMGSTRTVMSANASPAVPAARVAETDEEVFENLERMLDSFVGAGIVEASKFVKVHKAIHGNQKWYLSLAHTRISDRAGGLAWKEGWGLPEIHPLLKNTVKPFTDKNSRTRHTGRDYTGPCGCKQILFELLPQELKAKVLGLVNMAADELKDGGNGDDELQSTQSQAFPAFSQSQGSDTLRVCKLLNCGHQAQSTGEMEIHMESHPRCLNCGTQFLTAEHLMTHMGEHETFNCHICKKDVEIGARKSHVESHHRDELFAQTLEKGRTVVRARASSKASAPKATVGYHLFLRINYPKLKEQNQHLNRNQITKLVSAEWKALGPVGQQAYKTTQVLEQQQEQAPQQQQTPQQQQLQQLQEQLKLLQGQLQQNQLRRGAQGGSQELGLLNRSARASDQHCIFTCNVCGFLCSKETALKSHKETQVKFKMNSK